MPDKLTDTEIIKALECCVRDDSGVQECDGCPYDIYDHCTPKLRKATLDLINRLQAETERLLNLVKNQSLMIAEQDKEIKRLKKVQMQLDDLCKMHNIIKAEAYKEFAERLKENSIATFSWKGVVMVEEIDNLLKELVGEDNETKII